ncbi:MAG: hypothetical protein M0R32_11355 [Candidatus Cloacimonetes bacterium]|jgi:hypothetical protein|nr:hypothetical protein [Candidatus Cloacimonadota bacterium]
MDKIKKDVTAHSADEETRIPLLDEKDMKNLRHSNYEKLSSKWSKVYVIQHKNGKVAELKAASPVHACKMIGWRPRHIKVLSERDIVAGVQ